MPLGSLDRTPPPFFKQGTSALTKLVLFSSLSCGLMFADLHYNIVQPARWALSLIVYPVQWLALRPQAIWDHVDDVFESKQEALSAVDQANARLLAQSVSASQVEQLTLENNRLRSLLELRERHAVSAMAAEVLYEAADPFTRKMILNKGATQGVQNSSPVMDDQGILGQVTRVHPLVSEITLVTDREHSIPVLNTRTGARGVAFGESGGAPLLELRYMATNADIEEGDVLTTSGVDGVYPPGIPVAKVVKIERRADSVFARILCESLARVQAARHVMVLEPVKFGLPGFKELPPAPQPVAKGAK
ncbi:MAG: rod shape-determining protein MreC [Burkholderiales bacterium]|jgi:rod shape-determining protein MreC|nr:rod shape-determining protein MreC [Burkholderiales bacterium]